MRWTFLGTGGAFTRFKTDYHNNVLVEFGDFKALIDCSLGALESLDELGIDPLEIDAVIVTHIHGDHVSGLEELGFRQLFFDADGPLELITHPCILPSHAIPEVDHHDGTDLWENYLRGPMERFQDEKGFPVRAELSTYFEPVVMNRFELEGWEFDFFRTEHVLEKDSFGFEVYPAGEAEGPMVLFTADSRPLGEFGEEDRYDRADVIFHECFLGEYYPATVHTHFEELLEMPRERQEKMWLMHYGDDSDFDTSDGAFDLAETHQTFEFELEGDTDG